mgnify:CR=1 FL=1
MRLLTRIARITTGLIFIFSGFVKGIDPLGTAFKLGDYFSAFKIGFLDDLALPLSIILCTVEFVAGVMLVTGAGTRIASWAVALFMAVFTPVTLILALFNPVSDCGCFGDAIHLSNWQTFFKNLILTLIVVFVFIRRRDRTMTLSPLKALLTGISSMLLFLFFTWYNLTYLPVIDFRPFKPGANLPESMAIPPDAPSARYDVRFIYEKGGLEKEFTLKNYPAGDTTWKFVDQKSVIITEGYTPPIHDFSLVTRGGMDMTGEILGDRGFTLLMVARKLGESNTEGLAKGFNLGLAAQRQDVGFYVVTSTTDDEAAIMTAGFETLFADETTLKTVIRSNPGFVLLHNGTVMAKWSHKGLPKPEKFTHDLNTLAIKTQVQKVTILIVICSLLMLAVIYLITQPFRQKC